VLRDGRLVHSPLSILGTLPGGVLERSSRFVIVYSTIVWIRSEDFPCVPLEDQVFAGALMWSSERLFYTVPAVILTVQFLSGGTSPVQMNGDHLRKLAGQAYERSQRRSFKNGKSAHCCSN